MEDFVMIVGTAVLLGGLVAGLWWFLHRNKKTSTSGGTKGSSKPGTRQK